MGDPIDDALAGPLPVGLRVLRFVRAVLAALGHDPNDPRVRAAITDNLDVLEGGELK